jgi:hypothetical protein
MNERNEFMTSTLSPTASRALQQVLDLRKLSYENQTVTRRSQNAILQTLNSNDTIAVAESLAEHQVKFGW